jgi:intracellular sulfur oxidation DsrE/DsrF family protein
LAAQPRGAALDESTGAMPGLVIKVLFHLNSNDRDLIKQSLQDVESALKLYRRTGQRARIQIVANGEGLDLLRVGASPYPQTVQRMLQEYDNLQFVACQNTIEGWVYIRA